MSINSICAHHQCCYKHYKCVQLPDNFLNESVFFLRTLVNAYQTIITNDVKYLLCGKKNSQQETHIVEQSADTWNNFLPKSKAFAIIT